MSGSLQIDYGRHFLVGEVQDRPVPNFAYFPLVHVPGGPPSWTQEYNGLKGLFNSDMAHAMACSDIDEDEPPPLLNRLQVYSQFSLAYEVGPQAGGVDLMCIFDTGAGGGYYYFVLPEKPDDVTGPINAYYEISFDNVHWERVEVTIELYDWGNRIVTQTWLPDRTCQWPDSNQLAVPPNYYPQGNYGGTESSPDVYCSQLYIFWGLINTDPATLVKSHSATLNGDDSTDVTGAHFEWGLASGKVTDNVTPNQGGSSFSANLTGLTPGTEYQFRAAGTSGDQAVYGQTLTFKTTGYASTIETDPATNIMQSSAHLNGTYEGSDQAYVGFEITVGGNRGYYYVGSKYGIAPSVGMGIGLADMTPLYVPGALEFAPAPLPFGVDINGLLDGKSYSFRAFAALFNGETPDKVYQVIWGRSLSFSTLKGPPPPIKPTKNYPTARDAIDSLQTTVLGRFFMDDEGNAIYQSRVYR